MHIQEEVARMMRLPIAQLRSEYVTVIGERPRCSNRVQLVRRIAWRLQANVEGDLTERALRRAEELAHDSHLRLGPPARSKSSSALGASDAMAIHASASGLVGGGTRGGVLVGGSEGYVGGGAGRGGRERMGLPMVGAVISRKYKGKQIDVVILKDGFEYDGETYHSLSAVAKAVTGSHWNGRLFFGLTTAKRKEVAS